MSVGPGFWAFSTALYGQDGVKTACLDVQAAGLDVNVALFAAWAVITGRDPGPVMGEVLSRAALWRSSVVQKLRDARDQLKPAPDFINTDAALQLRQTILKAELEAERLQQAALEPLISACPARRGPGRRGEVRAHLSQAASAVGAGPGADTAIERFVEIIFSTLENV